MRQLVFTVGRSRINALVLQIGQLKEHHLRQRFEGFAPLARLCVFAPPRLQKNCVPPRRE